MVVKTKSGEYRAGTADVLLEFLGVKKEAGGRQEVCGAVELIASVPFCLDAHGAESGEGVSAVPDGIAWTFSTFDLDRFDERIDPAGWEFEPYLKNPVVEWAHCYDIPAIGRADGLYADEKGLHGSVVFNAKDYDPFGWAIGERVKAGVIRAGSVGFRPVEVEIPSGDEGKDGTRLIFRRQELLEFSVCNVPANPFATVELTSLSIPPFGVLHGKTPPQAIETPPSVAVRTGREQKTHRICSSRELSPFWGNFIGGNNGS